MWFCFQVPVSRHRAFGKRQKHPEVDRIDGTCLPAQGYNLDLSGGRTLLGRFAAKVFMG